MMLTSVPYAEVQAKKVFTAEEKAMRRAEMARRRRNLSEKRNEEVKVCYLQKLTHLTSSTTPHTVWQGLDSY